VQGAQLLHDKNKKTVTGRLELKKYCWRCRKHKVHKEAK